MKPKLSEQPPLLIPNILMHNLQQQRQYDQQQQHNSNTIINNNNIKTSNMNIKNSSSQLIVPGSSSLLGSANISIKDRLSKHLHLNLNIDTNRNINRNNNNNTNGNSSSRLTGSFIAPSSSRTYGQVQFAHSTHTTPQKSTHNTNTNNRIISQPSSPTPTLTSQSVSASTSVLSASLLLAHRQQLFARQKQFQSIAHGYQIKYNNLAEQYKRCKLQMQNKIKELYQDKNYLQNVVKGLNQRISVLQGTYKSSYSHNTSNSISQYNHNSQGYTQLYGHNYNQSNIYSNRLVSSVSSSPLKQKQKQKDRLNSEGSQTSGDSHSKDSQTILDAELAKLRTRVHAIQKQSTHAHQQKLNNIKQQQRVQAQNVYLRKIVQQHRKDIQRLQQIIKVQRLEREKQREIIEKDKEKKKHDKQKYQKQKQRQKDKQKQKYEKQKQKKIPQIIKLQLNKKTDNKIDPQKQQQLSQKSLSIQQSLIIKSKTQQSPDQSRLNNTNSSKNMKNNAPINKNNHNNNNLININITNNNINNNGVLQQMQWLRFTSTSYKTLILNLNDQIMQQGLSKLSIKYQNGYGYASTINNNNSSRR